MTLIEIINTSFDIINNNLVVINNIKVNLEESTKFYSILQKKHLEFEYNNIILKNVLINNEYILDIKKSCNLNTIDILNSEIVFIDSKKFIVGFYSANNNIYRKVNILEFNQLDNLDQNICRVWS